MPRKNARPKRRCVHKRTFPKASVAESALRKMTMTNPAVGEFGLRPYKCPLGSHWHLGHNSQR